MEIEKNINEEKGDIRGSMRELNRGINQEIKQITKSSEIIIRLRTLKDTGHLQST